MGVYLGTIIEVPPIFGPDISLFLLKLNVLGRVYVPGPTFFISRVFRDKIYNLDSFDSPSFFCDENYDFE
jgi:hypothetical protein